MKNPYLLELGTRLARGLSQMSELRRERHRAFVWSRQMPDGGFAGREDESDLYYTGFAVRCLSILGGLEPDQTAALAAWLRPHDPRQLRVVDLISWLYSAIIVEGAGGEIVLDEADDAWVDEITARLEAVRTDDGGYAKSPEGAAGSTYHSFLIALTYELLGRSIPRPNALLQFVYDRQRDDGGFVEIDPMRRSGTNPTAAAVALLMNFGALDDETRSDVHGFLRDVWSGEGGFLANSRIPFPDGLSTFTGLLTALDLKLDAAFDLRRIETFIAQELEFPTGGFRGAAWDDAADVEYSFYGLGVLGLLWSHRTPSR